MFRARPGGSEDVVVREERRVVTLQSSSEALAGNPQIIGEGDGELLELVLGGPVERHGVDDLRPQSVEPIAAKDGSVLALLDHLAVDLVAGRIDRRIHTVGDEGVDPVVPVLEQETESEVLVVVDRDLPVGEGAVSGQLDGAAVVVGRNVVDDGRGNGGGAAEELQLAGVVGLEGEGDLDPKLVRASSTQTKAVGLEIFDVERNGNLPEINGADSLSLFIPEVAKY